MDTKKLKQKILDLAIRGKLVPQNPNDKPASALLERIRAEKERLIKDKKIKRDKNESYIYRSGKSYYEKRGTEVRSIDDEIPFEIPDCWEWSRLGEVFRLQAGKNINGNDITEGFNEKLYPCYGGNGLRGYTTSFNRNGTYPIIGRQGALCGNINIALNKFYATEHAVTVDTFANISTVWSYYILQQLNLNQYATATAQPGLSVAKINNVYIPLPPLSEQNRIVERIEQAFALIDSIDLDKADLSKAIKQTKAKVLDLAIRGKLVAQEPNDEPASVLLERIKAQKQASAKGSKKPSKQPAQTSDNSHYQNIPFEIPDSWCFIPLEEVLEYEQPQKYIVDSTDYCDRFQTPVLTPGKSFIIGYTNETKGIYSNLPVIIFDDFTTDSRYVDFEFKVKSSAMKLLKSDERVLNLKYAALFMSVTRLISDTHKRYWISEYSKILIPLPPIAEQKRIVSKVDAIFNTFHNIAECLFLTLFYVIYYS